MADSITKPIFLYATVFIVGAAILIIEIVGTRMLAPFYGTTIYVWSSLISVTLAALALGYWGGGKAIDMRPRAWFMYSTVILAGLSLAILFLATNYILLQTSGLGLRFGPLVATAALFFTPLFFLGSISPMALKLRARTLEHIGLTAGRLYALATAGSLFGGLVTGFYLAPNYPPKIIIFLLSFTLVLLGLMGIAVYEDSGVWAKGKMIPFGIIVLFTFFAYYSYQILNKPFSKDQVPPALESFGGTQIATDSNGKPIHTILRTSEGRLKANVVYHKPSLYGDVIVFDYSSVLRCLVIDGANESCWNFTGNGGKGTASAYANNIATLLSQLTAEQNSNIKDVLIIGVGGGTLLKMLDGTSFTIDAVEINPDLPAISRDYFGLPKNLEYTMYTDDGRHFLNTTSKKYDAIVLDICEVNQASAHLRTEEFFALAQKHLRDPQNGVLITSLNIVVGNEKSKTLEQKLASGIGEHFSNVYAVAYETKYEDEYDVGIFLASNHSILSTSVNKRDILPWQFDETYTAFTDEQLDEAIRLGEPAAEAIRVQTVENFGKELLLPR